MRCRKILLSGLKLKLLVVTMEAGEAEFEESVQSVSEQDEVLIEHYFVRGLSEREAHRELAKLWLNRRGDFNYICKVDADTILHRKKSLASMTSLMCEDSADFLSVRLLDYFSEQLIHGLNMYSQKVVFASRPSRLYPDLLKKRSLLRTVSAVRASTLEPIGLHGKNPAARQSFYYGYHRFLKGQKELLMWTYLKWLSERDFSRRWALIGARIAHKQNLFQRLKFSSQYAFHLFEVASSLDISDSELVEFGETQLRYVENA